MSADDKPLFWLSGEVKSPPFTPEARLEAGFLLRKLQRGDSLGLPQSRPMPSIGRRCHELRIVDEDVTWRIIYAVETDAVVILDIFKKKSRATPGRIIRRSQARLRAFRSARSAPSDESS